MANPVPIPTNDPFVKARDWLKNPKKELPDPEEGKLTDVAIKYLENQGSTLTAAPTTYSPTQLEAQSGSIALVPIEVGALSAGLYRFTFYVAVTGAAGISSSIQVNLSWTDLSLTKTHAFPAYTGNTNSSTDSGTYMVRIDGNSPISFSTVYTPVGAAGSYDLAIMLELLNR